MSSINNRNVRFEMPPTSQPKKPPEVQTEGDLPLIAEQWQDGQAPPPAEESQYPSGGYVIMNPADAIFRTLSSPSSKKKGKSAPISDITIDKVVNPISSDWADIPINPLEFEENELIINAFVIGRKEEKTLIFAAAINKDNPEDNINCSIKCGGGAPLGGYVHDLWNDSYIVSCLDIIQIGQVAFSFSLTMKNVGEWRVRIPIPHKLIIKYLTSAQKMILDNFCSKYRQHEVSFVQMISCN